MNVIQTLRIAATLLFLSSSCAAQLRIVSYNTAGDLRDGSREQEFATVLKAIGQEDIHGISRPIDILLLQEQKDIRTDTVQIAEWLNQIHKLWVYRAGELEGDETTNGRVGRPGVVYRSDVVELLDEFAIGQAATRGQPRQTLRYDFGLVGYPSDAKIHIYNSHYKSGTSRADIERRLVEAEAIRADSDSNPLVTAAIIYAGDFNIRSSDEEMYQRLLSDGPGKAVDPIDSPGTWRNNEAFKRLHTQSPVNDVRFDGQFTGGMDDRFDFQLVSEELLDSEGLDYITGSYRAFGNDGSHPLDGEIIEGRGAESHVLEALAAASDHLPVVADYQLPARMQVEVSIPDVIAVNRASDNWLIAITNDGPNARAIDELDYEISFLGESFVVTDVQGASRVEHRVPLDYRSLGTHSLDISVVATSPLTANPSFAESISYTVAIPGDANLDGLFDSGDLVTVFQAGEYEDLVLMNSVWTTGDWNGDAEFDTGDLVFAFQDGGFETGLRDSTAVPEPASLVTLLIGLVGLAMHRQSSRQPNDA